jgi:hypothetical protein
MQVHAHVHRMYRGWLAKVFAAGALVALGACGAHDSRPDGAATPDDGKVSSSDAEFAHFVAKLSPRERGLFGEFLKNVSCTQFGCSVQDMALGSRERVAEYFVGQVLKREEKGLVVQSSLRFTNTITVCWTADSNASTADKAAVIENVEATWKGYANLAFDWYSSGTTPRICNSQQAPSFNIKIWQDTTQTRGCAVVGKNTQVGIGCTGSVAHSYANMLLGAGSIPSNSITAVHEFGHAIGFYHEQDRGDSTCSEGDNPLEPGAVAVGPYDANSIMNYCADKAGPEISSGDVIASVFMYGGRTTSPTFRTRSWLPTDVTYTVSLPSGGGMSVTQLSVSTSPANLAFGSAMTGSIVTMTATDSTLRCALFGPAPRVNDSAYRVLFSTGSTIPAECYSPALITTLL